MQSSSQPQGEQHNFEGEGETGKRVGRSIYTCNTFLWCKADIHGKTFGMSILCDSLYLQEFSWQTWWSQIWIYLYFFCIFFVFPKRIPISMFVLVCIFFVFVLHDIFHPYVTLCFFCIPQICSETNASISFQSWPGHIWIPSRSRFPLLQPAEHQRGFGKHQFWCVQCAQMCNSTMSQSCVWLLKRI